jgi:hypothetical protein
MKLSWLRLALSAMIVFAALAGAALRLSGPAAHDCASMSMTDACPDHAGGHATAPRHCDSLICGAVELTAPTTPNMTNLTTAGLARPIFDDLALRSFSARPDLRPPIL